MIRQPASVLTKADLVARFLASKNVPAVFELSGGMIAFITDAISRLAKTQIVSTRHEQAAGFAAEGATRVSGYSAVAMGTSGPGATNLVTAIASSFFDSVPTIFITGQVNQNEIKKSYLQRQNGFQELDIVQLVSGITKYAVAIDSKIDIEYELEKAWIIANEGRPGPVLLDIPIDVQQEIVIDNSKDLLSSVFESQVDSIESKVQKIVEYIKASKRPLFLAGGGIRTSKSTEMMRKIVEQFRIPVVHSLMGSDVLESNSIFRIGMLGSYGNRWANRAIARADLLIVLGSRLDIRQTGSDLQGFSKNKKVVRVDIDVSELEGRFQADLSVKMDLSIFLKSLEKENFVFPDSNWLDSIKSEEIEFPQYKEQPKEVTFNPDEIMRWITEVSKESNGFVVDVGQHQMWAAQSIGIGFNQRFLTSGGLGAMGYAIPTAIGASIAQKGRWIAIAGDGCTQLSIAELQTIKQLNLPITLCIINNKQHGMVAQFQESNMNGRYISTRDGYSAPDFCEVARAYGIEAHSISNTKKMESLTELAANQSSGPILFEFLISNEAKALPKMEMGSSVQDL